MASGGRGGTYAVIWRPPSYSKVPVTNSPEGRVLTEPVCRSDLFDRRAVGSALNGLAPLASAVLGRVRLALGDDLAVAGLETEPVLPCLVLVDLELSGHRSSWVAGYEISRLARRRPTRKACPGEQTVARPQQDPAAESLFLTLEQVCLKTFWT